MGARRTLAWPRGFASGGGNSIISGLTLSAHSAYKGIMATGEESFKSFLARRKQEYSLQFPFLQERQIVAKLRRLWAGGRTAGARGKRFVLRERDAAV